MAIIALSIGSNINPVANISQAVRSLESLYENIRLSDVYESKAVGFEGDNFLNLVAVLDVEQQLGDLIPALKAIEDQQGRDRSEPKFSGRTLDIDILLFDSLCGECEGITLPRPEITENAFVLLPLSDVLPDARHPLLDKTYRQLWMDFDQKKQALWKIKFEWLDG